MLNIFIFLAIWILLWSPIAFLLGKRLAWDFPHPPTPEQKIPLVLSLYILAPPLLWGLLFRAGETGRSLGWFWTAGFALQLLLGLLLAVLSLLMLWSLERLLGWIEFAIDRGELFKLMGPILGVAIAISTIEELIFRGFIATRLASADIFIFSHAALTPAIFLALALTNLIFAFLHLPWDRWQNVVPQLPGLWILGMVLSAACWRWGNLAMAIGLHAGWVWAIATLDTIGGIKYTERVPAWVTGVNGYLLAGVMGVVFLSAIGGLIVGLPQLGLM